jgi:thiol-disulfide isomerase/thioredoxin
MTASKPMIVGRIHAKWCGHCKNLEPEWAKLKKQIGKGKPRFVSIEQTNEEPHLDRLNKFLGIVDDDKKVKLQGGYPTIFKVHNGKVEYYNGPRMAKDISEWVTSMMTYVSGGKKQTKRSKNGKRSTRRK